LPRRPGRVVADRGYRADALRARLRPAGARPVIPTGRDEAEARRPDWAHANRDRVERPWARLKGWRAVATRHEETGAGFLGVLGLAAAADRLKS
jgi:hypothetical protein